MIDYDAEFCRAVDRLSGEIKKRARAAIRDLVDARDPGALGVRKGVNKKGPKCAVYAYEINRSYRILYCIGGNYLRFILVGDHKVVYGKD